jgi:hypothetical protein
VGIAIDAITGDARLVTDNGPSRSHETIKERGLAHIRAADDCYEGDWLHGKLRISRRAELIRPSSLTTDYG